MGKPVVKLGFKNMWHGLVTPEKFFKNMPYMFNHFDMVVDPDPDFIIYSVFRRHRKSRPGNSHIVRSRKKRVKIFYTPENIRPNMNKYDWAFSYDYPDKFGSNRQFRLPFYTLLGAGRDLIKKNINVNKILKEKTKFCAFVYSHGSRERNFLFKELSKYKKIDSPGKVFNNMKNIGSYASCRASRDSLLVFDEKLEFLKPYKFVIAYENSSFPGYTTEKIYHPMLANALPIYWGNPLIHRDFNRRSFINRHDFVSLRSMIDRIIQIDRNDSLYIKYLRAAYYPKNKLTPYVNPGRIVKQFKRIFSRKR